jgi:hypothetical protein
MNSGGRHPCGDVLESPGLGEGSGAKRWSLRRRASLPPGRYVILVEANEVRGNARTLRQALSVG